MPITESADISIFLLIRSWLTDEAKTRLPEESRGMYERIWDESDYVIPPSENNAFFVMTNVVLTPNQTRTTCPEDPAELPDVVCGYKNVTSGEVDFMEGVCVKGHIGNLIKSHGKGLRAKCIKYSIRVLFELVVHRNHSFGFG